MKTLYPDITPFQTFWLDTGDGHSIYVEQSGNPAGLPVVFLHGGPCSGTRPEHRCFFNPEQYHIVLFDQRGCGQSLPFGELNNNTTAHLLADLERIREHLNIRQWLVFGGSWGGALALLYAQQHTERVSGLIIRAVFLVRQQDVDWFIKDGAPRIYPERWQSLLDSLPDQGRGGVLASLCRVLWGDDNASQQRATQAWMAWSAQVALGNAYQPDNADEPVTEKMIRQVRMELHYARHQYFIADNPILDNCRRLQHIPTLIVHGRQDLLCPIEAGMTLHLAMPDADYLILPNAGHVARHPEMTDALVAATDRFAALLSQTLT